MSQFEALFKDPSESKPVRKPRNHKSSTPAVAVTVDTPPSNRTEKPAGKSNERNKDVYSQVLTYVKKDIHNQVKAALIFDKKGRNLSDLVEELLAGWLRKNRNG
jgi:hypothetical protein